MISFERDSVHGSVTTADAVSEYEQEYDVLVMEACLQLAATGAGRFHIGGFGDPNWSLDLAYDLSAFMEQFPQLLTGIRKACEVEVDIYSQGIERQLTFSPRGDDVEIRCTSRIEWTPDPEIEIINRDTLLYMLQRLATSFTVALKSIDSPIVNLEPFSNWLKGSI